ncbi:unnamed protein product [Schistosoma turkestanicum]|nr:unnamed protein product [Schistosoma turkestanicum]
MNIKICISLVNKLFRRLSDFISQIFHSARKKRNLDPPSEIKSRSFTEVTLDHAVIIWPGSLNHDQSKRSFQLERRNGLWKSVFSSINETNKAITSSYYLQAVPFPQAIWTINNAPLPSTLNIFVSQLEQAIILLNVGKEMDSKVIRARLINGYGRVNNEVFSQTHIIQVKDPPVNMTASSLDLVLPPKDVSITLKDDQPATAVFECVFNARPSHALRVQWFKRVLNGKRELINPSNVTPLLAKQSTNHNSSINDQTIYQFDTSGLNRTLIISNILPSVIPSDYFQQINVKEIYFEEYTCHAYLDDYNRNNVFDMNKFMLDDSQFTTSILSSSLWPSTTSTINIYQSVSPISTTARLKLYLPPKIHFPSNLNANSLTSQFQIIPKYNKLIIIETSASMTVQLPCELDHFGIPKAEVKWLRNGESIDMLEQEYYEIHANNSLLIKNLKLTDAGIFQCYAYNDVDEDFLNIWLKVTSFAPRLCNSETGIENITVLTESTTVLTCPIHGAPTPEFKWYKETNENEWTPIDQLYRNLNHSSIETKQNNLVDQNVTGVNLMNDQFKSPKQLSNSCVSFGSNELKIDHVDYKSTGRYKCEAVNYLGNESAFINVHVYARTVPVHNLPSSITAFANQSLSLMCSFHIDQHTLAEINWYHGRKEFTLSGEKHQQHKNTMIHRKTSKPNTKVITNYNLVKSIPIDPVITSFSREVPQKYKTPIGLKEYGSILHVTNVNELHQGYYICEILSPSGNYTLKTELKVISLPLTPINLSVINELEVNNNYDHNNDIRRVQLTWKQPQTTDQLKITHYAIFIHKLFNQHSFGKKNCEIIMDEEWKLFSMINLNETTKNTSTDYYVYTMNDSVMFQAGSYCISVSSVNFLGWSSKSNAVLYSVSRIPKIIFDKISIKLYLINVTSTSMHVIWVTTLQTNKFPLSFIKEYQLYYWIENSDFVEVKKCSNLNNFLQHTELTYLKSSKRYHLKIAACNNYECGPFSEVLQIQTLPHESLKTPSIISVIVHENKQVEISFVSDYIERSDYYIEQMKGYLIKLSCIDPPGCFDVQIYLPIECVTDRDNFSDNHFSVNQDNENDNHPCNELNQSENSTFLHSVNMNRSNRRISLVLNSLSPYTLYELFVAYVYPHRIGPFSKPAEVFRTNEDVPSRITNLVVNTDGSDGLIVEWDAPENPNGKILQYILHYTEIKPIDLSADSYRLYRNKENAYHTPMIDMNQGWLNRSTNYDHDIYYREKQSIFRFHPINHLPSSTTDSNYNSMPTPMNNDNRNYAGYYSLNESTHRLHIESLIHEQQIYQIRMFALNKAGLSSVSLQLGFTSSSSTSASLLPMSKYKHSSTEKIFMQWINLIHLNKHEEKLFQWLNNTRIEFTSEPMVLNVNAHDAEFLIEFDLKLDDNVSNSIHSNASSPVVGDFARIIKLIEKCKWPIRVQQTPLNGYQAVNGNNHINSWNWQIITAHKYNTSQAESNKFDVNQRVHLSLSFKLLNLHSYHYYRIEVWQPIGLLFGNYKQITSKSLLHSNSSKWFKIQCQSPTVSPSLISTYMLNLNQMKIIWQPLAPEEWNGIPSGYLITVQKAETKHALHLMTTYPNPNHKYHTNETVNIQVIQGKCGLDYLQIFINDSTAFSYIIEDLEPDKDYAVGIRAVSVENENSDKWLLGPQTVTQALSVYKYAKDKEDIKFLTWMRTLKFIPYNLKVLREADYIVMKWKESLKVECGHLPSYQLIFNKIWFNETFHSDDDVNYVKFISFNDTNLNRSKTLQSTDSFYENILKLPLNTLLDSSEMCYFNGILKFQLNVIGQPIKENTEQAIVYVNLEEEKIKHRLLLRKIIPMSKQKKARVLISWIPNTLTRNLIFPYTNLFILQWTRIDPITYANLSLPLTKLISWPNVNNLIKTMKLSEITLLKQQQQQQHQHQYSEYLIVIDELFMESTYLFELIKLNSNQTMNASVHDENLYCSSKAELLVYVTTVELSQTLPRQRPISPKIQISEDNFMQKQYKNTICPIVTAHLSWPNYLRHLQTNQTAEYGSGLMYTSPVTNYTLQYAEIMNNYFNENNYGSIRWKTYQPSPQVDEVNDFVVDRLQPHKMYIFRLAAQTDAGVSPFSPQTDILVTNPQRPCYSPLKLEFEFRSQLYPEISQHTSHISNRKREIVTQKYCEYILLKWKVLSDRLWNSQPAWYHITYQLWSIDYQMANTQLFNLFVKHDKNNINNSYLHVELKNLMPRKYYLISIKAINDYSTTSLFSSMVQASSSILIHSGIGCGNPMELQNIPMKQMIMSSIMHMNTVNYPVLLSKSLLSPREFFCLSDQIQVLIKCTWDFNEFQSILGFILEVHEFGDRNYKLSYDSIKTYSIFIKPHVHDILLYSVSSIIQSNVIMSDQTIIKPYFYYKLSIHVITAGGHGPKVYFPRFNDQQTQIDTNVKSHNSTENVCLSGELICTAQSPPNSPFHLTSQWLSRDKIKLDWLHPEQLNGKLVNYRVTYNEIIFQFTDNQIIGEIKDSINNKNLGLQSTMKLKAFETTYTVDQLHENTTYLFKVEARTESKQNDGWSRPTCIYVSTSYCWFNSPQVIRVNSQSTCDFTTLIKTVSIKFNW